MNTNLLKICISLCILSSYNCAAKNNSSQIESYISPIIRFSNDTDIRSDGPTSAFNHSFKPYSINPNKFNGQLLAQDNDRFLDKLLPSDIIQIALNKLPFKNLIKETINLDKYETKREQKMKFLNLINNLANKLHSTDKEIDPVATANFLRENERMIPDELPETNLIPINLVKENNSAVNTIIHENVSENKFPLEQSNPLNTEMQNNQNMENIFKSAEDYNSSSREPMKDQKNISNKKHCPILDKNKKCLKKVFRHGDYIEEILDYNIDDDISDPKENNENFQDFKDENNVTNNLGYKYVKRSKQYSKYQNKKCQCDCSNEGCQIIRHGIKEDPSCDCICDQNGKCFVVQKNIPKEVDQGIGSNYKIFHVKACPCLCNEENNCKIIKRESFDQRNNKWCPCHCQKDEHCFPIEEPKETLETDHDDEEMINITKAIKSIEKKKLFCPCQCQNGKCALIEDKDSSDHVCFCDCDAMHDCEPFKKLKHLTSKHLHSEFKNVTSNEKNVTNMCPKECIFKECVKGKGMRDTRCNSCACFCNKKGKCRLKRLKLHFTNKNKLQKNDHEDVDDNKSEVLETSSKEVNLVNNSQSTLKKYFNETIMFSNDTSAKKDLMNKLDNNTYCEHFVINDINMFICPQKRRRKDAESFAIQFKNNKKPLIQIITSDLSPASDTAAMLIDDEEIKSLEKRYSKKKPKLRETLPLLHNLFKSGKASVLFQNINDKLSLLPPEELNNLLEKLDRSKEKHLKLEETLNATLKNKCNCVCSGPHCYISKVSNVTTSNYFPCSCYCENNNTCQLYKKDIRFAPALFGRNSDNLLNITNIQSSEFDKQIEKVRTLSKKSLKKHVYPKNVNEEPYVNLDPSEEEKLIKIIGNKVFITLANMMASRALEVGNFNPSPLETLRNFAQCKKSDCSENAYYNEPVLDSYGEYAGYNKPKIKLDTRPQDIAINNHSFEDILNNSSVFDKLVSQAKLAVLKQLVDWKVRYREIQAASKKEKDKGISRRKKRHIDNDEEQNQENLTIDKVVSNLKKSLSESLQKAFYTYREMNESKIDDVKKQFQIEGKKRGSEMLDSFHINIEEPENIDNKNLENNFSFEKPFAPKKVSFPSQKEFRNKRFEDRKQIGSSSIDDSNSQSVQNKRCWHPSKHFDCEPFIEDSKLARIENTLNEEQELNSNGREESDDTITDYFFNGNFSNLQKVPNRLNVRSFDDTNSKIQLVTNNDDDFIQKIFSQSNPFNHKEDGNKSMEIIVDRFLSRVRKYVLDRMSSRNAPSSTEKSVKKRQEKSVKASFTTSSTPTITTGSSQNSEQFIEPSVNCDYFDSKSNTCWFNRPLGGHVLFGVLIKEDGLPGDVMVAWQRLIHYRDGSMDSVHISNTGLLPWNIDFNNQMRSVSIAPLTDADLDSNGFKAKVSCNENSSFKEIGELNFKVNIMPIEVEYHFGEKVKINLENYATLPLHQTVDFEWQIEFDPFHYEPIPPTSKWLIEGGKLSMINTVDLGPKSVVCIVYSNSGMFLTKRRFLITMASKSFRTSFPFNKYPRLAEGMRNMRNTKLKHLLKQGGYRRVAKEIDKDKFDWLQEFWTNFLKNRI